MNRFIKITLFAIIIGTFYGCPVGLDYPIEAPGNEKIDEKLLGTWKNNNPDEEIIRVKISKKDNHSYNVQVLEKGEMYALESDNFIGWICSLQGKKFLYFKPDNEDKYYHYFIKELKDNKMISCDLALLDGGKDAVTSTESLQKEVISSMKMEGFCAETEQWTKE
jgi:hypothetical protein